VSIYRAQPENSTISSNFRAISAFRIPHQKSALSPLAENCAPTLYCNHSDAETKTTAPRSGNKPHCPPPDKKSLRSQSHKNPIFPELQLWTSCGQIKIHFSHRMVIGTSVAGGEVAISVGKGPSPHLSPLVPANLVFSNLEGGDHGSIQ
jgi:hypothetical protein